MQITTLPKDDVKRGEIYYISRGGYNTGSEQQADRPGVIVSNDKNNKNSQTLEVVYLTTRPKNELPTHCTIRSTGRVSTVLCEQIHTVAVGTHWEIHRSVYSAGDAEHRHRADDLDRFRRRGGGDKGQNSCH